MAKVWAQTHLEEHMRYGALQVQFVGLVPELLLFVPLDRSAIFHQVWRWCAGKYGGVSLASR